ncbi:hypothetical protein QTO16_02730 [Vibrio harveyi]|uniref:hypothetical protein n=1 Tax=Vibrio harveyi TaxID=669 RepID=UPI00215C4E8D|nr:hypothetical protein [Vibrio harveyi]MCR9770531.1 hypothetical protein [Vibrio harveyi]
MIKPTSAWIILVLCIAGYFFFNALPHTRYKLKRTSGYHTFLFSAGGGLLLFGIAGALLVIGIYLGQVIPFHFSLGKWFLNDILQCEASYALIAMFDMAIASLVLARIVPIFFTGVGNRRRFDTYTKFWYSDPESTEFTKLFFKSLEFGRPILFTMSDSKVYIGYVYEIYAGDINDILVLPYYSGYRDKDTRELVLVTPYRKIISDVMNKSERELDLEAFLISLPIRDISHAHLHDFEYQKAFNEEEEKLKRQKRKGILHRLKGKK